MKNSKKMNKNWMQFKVSTLAASITALILSSIPYHASASDIDIYQSGGTGATTIYLMLDKSGSMNNLGSMAVDYDHFYKARNCTYTLKNVGNKNGSYDQNGIYVGAGKGRYDKVENCSLESSANTRTCGYTTDRWNNVNWTNISILENNLLFPGTSYKYGIKSEDLYCSIDLKLITENTIGNNKYKEKIRNICDLKSDDVYDCYSRILKLRKGLINLILDSSIDETIYLGMGLYTGDGISEVKPFTSMENNNKSSFITEIEKIKANGGTPIATAYKTAGNKFLNSPSNSSLNTRLECSGNGIYFLTDGEPQGDSPSFSFGTYDKSKGNTLNSKSDYWKEIGYYSQYLRDSKNKIKTATVGFGGGYYLTADQIKAATITQNKKTYFDCSYIDTVDSDHRSLCQWGAKTIPNRTDVGGFGEGGFYLAQSSDELVASLKSFVSEVTVDVEGTTMGSSTIPVDALNTSELQPYAYFPMFKPLIGTEDQLWAGNLKKFNVSNGSLFDVKNIPVFKNASDFNAKLQDYWYTAEGKNSDEFLAFGGNLSQLQAKMKVLSESNTAKIKRNLFINDNGILKPAVTVLEGNSLADREYLYGLLGYSTLTTQNLTDLKSKSYPDQLKYLATLGAPKADYQLGAIIHSSPLLLTQKGVVEYGTDGFTSKDREDYILFGTTQGVLHVLKAGQQNKQSLNNGVSIDATGGEEVFSFVPKEMLAKQKTGFIESLAQKRSQTVADGGGFFYGIDGPWVAHTEYEASIYQTPKLDANGNKILDDQNMEIQVQREGLAVKPDSEFSHQYVYGGLRMGGRSYYALNLSNISNPQMLFHINPADFTSGPLSYMGQSWSKPTVTYINWNGKKKLAMIVGGGYDEKYEISTYKKSDTDSVKGNGVYIFDAKNGDLLWWGSSLATEANAEIDTSTSRVKTPASSNIATMTNSIPSRIKVVDRNGDGVTDHLYVGDLGGQVFRIDLSSEHHIDTDTKKAKKFTINAFKFADLNTVGKNPLRFYEAPTFTIHRNAGKNYAVITLASGDRSSPLVTNDANGQDLIVGLFDESVTQSVPSVGTLALTNLQQIYSSSATAVKDAKGWLYKLPIAVSTTTKYQSRGLAEGIALDNDLYYSIFDPRKSTTSTSSSTSCTGGIIGESTAYKLCLPNGVCNGATDIIKVGGLGSGIIALNIGPGSDPNSRTLVLNNKSLSVVPDEYTTKNKLLPRRWFEYSPYKVDSEK